MFGLVEYALKYIGQQELEYYCMDTETKMINMSTLKHHLIGKVGCNEKEVSKLYREEIK